MKQMTQRQQKVANEVRNVAARALLSGQIMSTMELTRVTVVDAWVSADLRLARLYVSLPQGADEQEWLGTLNREVDGQLRKALAKELATKYIPAVSFYPVED